MSGSCVLELGARDDSSIAPLRTLVLLFALGAMFGLILTVIGIYGVLAAGVRQRHREIGIRSALGATRVRIGALILREALTMAAGGMLGGSTNGLTWLVVLATAGGVTVIGTCVPLWRAVSVAPIAALHRE